MEVARDWPIFDTPAEQVSVRNKGRSKVETRKETTKTEEILEKIEALQKTADRIQAYLTVKRRAIAYSAPLPKDSIKEVLDFEKIEAHLRRKIEFYKDKLSKRI